MGMLVSMPVSAASTVDSLEEPLGDRQGLADAWALLAVSLPTSASGAQRVAAEPGGRRRPEVASLLAVSASTHRRHSRGQAAASGPRGPKDPSWFDNLDDLDDVEDAVPGDARRLQNKFDSVPPKFFHEAASGGPDEAWQTHYPAIGSQMHNPATADFRQANRQWRLTDEGWIYRHAPALDDRRGPTKASWFDGGAGDRDAFGRRMPPPEGSVERLLKEPGGELWTERSVNTTVRCPDRGCIGKSMLRAFDVEKEEAVNCRLNIAVFPTDFDNKHSRENIEYWRVNGHVVKSECSVGESGCVDRRPLVSCLREFSVDHLIDSSGSMLVEGKLNKMVDECPYKGNLLSSVAQVTCLVRPKMVARPSAPTLSPSAAAEMQRVLETCKTYSSKLRCREPGCTAETALEVEPYLAYLGGTFKMTVTLVVTDFDQAESDELVEFVSLAGRGTLATQLTPNKSQCPCGTGQPKPTGPRETFKLVQDLDVTDDVAKSRALKISAKISDMVDECDSDGYLLDGLVEVTCTPPQDLVAPTR